MDKKRAKKIFSQYALEIVFEPPHPITHFVVRPRYGKRKKEKTCSVRIFGGPRQVRNRLEAKGFMPTPK